MLFFRTLLLTRDGLLPFEEYCAFYLRLSKLLLSPHFHLSAAKQSAQSDWDDDMRRSGAARGSAVEQAMDCDTFAHSLFEMLSMFVLLHDAQQLVFILNKAYALLTQTSSSSNAHSSHNHQLVVTFLPLASLSAHVPFNAHSAHNGEYNAYAHTAAQSLRHALFDTDIEFTVPLLPPLSVDPLLLTAAAGKARWLGGLKAGPTRNGLQCSIGAMDEHITLHSPYTAMLPAQWSVAKWQRDNERKQRAAARAAAAGASDEQSSDEKQSATSEQRWRDSFDAEEPFVVRERRERAANRMRHSQTVTLGDGGYSGSRSSSRRASAVMDVDDEAGEESTAASIVQPQPQSAAQRSSRYNLFL